MIDREQLLDELARIYAHAAVDALLAQQGSDAARPGGTLPPSGLESRQEHQHHGQSTPGAAHAEATD